MKNWRPENWVKIRNIWFGQNQPKPPHYKIRQLDFEAGVSAMIGVLLELDKEPPTQTFTIDSGIITIYGEIIKESE